MMNNFIRETKNIKLKIFESQPKYLHQGGCWIVAKNSK